MMPSPQPEVPSEATWTVVLENIGLVYMVIKDHCRRPQDWNDLFQEGMIGLFEGARRFDSAFGTAFSTFVVPHIRRRVLGFFQNKESDGQTVQLAQRDDETQDFDNQTILSTNEKQYVKFELRTDIVKHLNALDARERAIIILRWLFPDELTVRQVGDKIGLTGARVCQLEQKALKKLRESMQKRRSECDKKI
jgi:RNA polymerase sigma factor (sigma-70 family)